MTFHIKSVAIIGAGPSGLATLYEFLHTTKEGTSTFGSKEANDKLFDKLVVFEQNSDVGGVWLPFLHEADPPLPSFKILQSQEYHKASSLQQNISVPEDFLENTSFTKRYKLKRNAEEENWNKSALHSSLFTNIPRRFTRFSSTEYVEPQESRVIDPYITHSELLQHIKNYADVNHLKNHIRFNTQVRSVKKDDGKWTLILRYISPHDGTDEWYQETFDAVAVANGHYAVPYIPLIKGLEEYAVKHPGSIAHAKSFRDEKVYTDKKVIVVGSAISGIGLAQFIRPIAAKFILSRQSRNEIVQWLNNVREANLVEVRPPISQFVAETKEVVFEDDSRVQDFDHIILATGYHYHYPFFEKKFLKLSIPPNKKAPANNSRIQNLYYNIFKMNEPTIAFVGIVQTSMLFTAFETQAAAIAGVWSNVKKLPAKEEQYEWERKRLEERPDDTRFYMFSNTGFKTEYVDKLVDLLPIGRKYPLDHNYFDHFDDFKVGENALEKLFYKIVQRSKSLEEELEV